MLRNVAETRKQQYFYHYGQWVCARCGWHIGISFFEAYSLCKVFKLNFRVIGKGNMTMSLRNVDMTMNQTVMRIGGSDLLSSCLHET
jgi:hypothetical protein